MNWKQEESSKKVFGLNFFDFLIEQGQQTDHPVGRGKYTPYVCGECQTDSFDSEFKNEPASCYKLTGRFLEKAW